MFVVFVSSVVHTEVLTLPLRALWVQRPPGDLEVDSGTEHPIQRVEPVTRSWSPDAAGNVQVNRGGCQIVPDFAGTIHRNVEFRRCVLS